MDALCSELKMRGTSTHRNGVDDHGYMVTAGLKILTVDPGTSSQVSGRKRMDGSMREDLSMALIIILSEMLASSCDFLSMAKKMNFH